METVPSHPLLIVTKENMKKIRQGVDSDDVKKINDSLDILEEWCKKQPHLVEAYNNAGRCVLERLFILSRGSVEGTKTKIDKLFTSRGMMPELSLNRTSGEFKSYLEKMTYVPLPKMCPSDQSRVIVGQIKTSNLDDFSLLTHFRYAFLSGEYRLFYDYSLAERYIFDLGKLTLSFISKMNPVLLKKAEILCTEGYGTQIKGIHILNAPPFVDKLMMLLKQVLKEKVASRIHVHPSYEDLHKHIPKEILPKDYNGDEVSLEKLSTQWSDTLRTEEAQQILKKLDKFVADETKRSSAKFNEEYLGMPGSFRKLDVD